jgi:hypothetical protein
MRGDGRYGLAGGSAVFGVSGGDGEKMNEETKIAVYPPGPVAPTSPIQSLVIDEGDEVEWIYMTINGTMNYAYGYTVIKPVNLYEAGEEVKRLIGV